MLWSLHSDCLAKHNVLGSIPCWGASFSTRNTSHGHYRVTVSGGSTEPYAMMYADPSPSSSGFRHLKEALTSSRGCYSAAFPHRGAFPTSSHAFFLTPTTSLGIKCALWSPGR